MIIYLQFPLTDIRLFIKENTDRLPLPLWPSPSPYKEFVRCFGLVRIREKGGVRGWVGENEICDARQAIRFSLPCNCLNSQTNKKINFRCSARHFYFDGIAVGKFEVVLVSRPDRLSLSSESFMCLIKDILHLPLSIKTPLGERVIGELVRADKPITMLYQAASSKTISYLKNKDTRWVIPGTQVLIAEFSEPESVEIPDDFDEIPIKEEHNIKLFHCWLRDEYSPIRLWLINKLPGAKSQFVHVLRLFLMRLNAEHECLKIILKKIDSGEISLSESSMESFFLQHYLNEATRRISRMDLKNEARWETDLIGEVARSSFDISSPGQLDSILNKVRLANIRPQVFRKFEHVVNQIFIKEQTMGDKYSVGQAGAVGPHSHAHDMSFTQIWNQSCTDMNLKILANELSILRQALKEKSTEPDHDIAVGEISYAEKAAKESDGPRAIEHLAKAGRWALDIATQIGVNVAASALKMALGLP